MPKVVFIAISGVRIVNPKLVELGVTLPGFVERAEVIASMPSLGLLTLAALTPAHYDIRYIEMPELDEEALASIDADLVALSSFTAKAYVMYAVADQLRGRGITVVLGGLHCTLAPDDAQPHADAVVQGEGERVWPQLLKDFEAKRLCPRYRAADFGTAHLEESPVPRYDLLEMERYNRLPLQTARGCPLACEFCAASRWLGRYRKKPIARVEAELSAVRQLWRQPFIELADDNTFIDKAWSKALVKTLAKSGVPWFTETDVSIGDDLELLDLLADSGCRQLLIGFESPERSGLVGLDNANFKSRRFDSYRRVIDEVQKRRITVNGCFILGLDSHTPDVFEQVEWFVETSGLYEVQVTVQTPFPGTALYARLLREGRLLQPGRYDHCTLFDVTYQPARMSVKELEDGLAYLMGALYREGAKRSRQRRFFGLSPKEVRP